MFVLSSPSPSRPPLVESSVGPSCSLPSTPPRPRWQSEASPWDTSGPWQSSPMSCRGSPLASAAAPWNPPEDPSYPPTVPRLLGPWARPMQEASAPALSPPDAGPGSSLGSPMAPGSSPPCTPPSRRWEAEASPPDTEGPWQTSPISLMGSALSWGRKPGEPPEDASSWPPCTHRMGRRDAEGSPAGAPGPWQTSPVSSSGSPLSWGADRCEPREEPCSRQSRCREAETSPPGPWQTSPVSSVESPRGWVPDPAEPRDAHSSWLPCIPPSLWRVAAGSSPYPWQTSPVSLEESPLGWGPDPD